MIFKMADDEKVIKGAPVNFEGDSNIKADQLEQIVNNPNTEPQISQQINSPLEKVEAAAIEEYVKGISRATINNNYFFAYFYKLKIDDDKVSFSPIETMYQEDLIEAARAVFGKNITNTDILKHILKKKNFNEQGLVKIDYSIFPEYYEINSTLSTINTKLIKSNSYQTLMLLPPRARTLFAGAIYKSGKIKNQDLTTFKDADKTKIYIHVSTKEIIDYAVEIGIENVSIYLEMIAEGFKNE